MECPFDKPFKQFVDSQGYGVADANFGEITVPLETQEQSDYVFKAINSHEKFKTYKTERENIFVLLNEKQLPIVGGMCLDSIIRNLVKQFERRQSFIEEHDECEAYREYEVFCNEQEIKQLEAEKKK
jgi:hypothetical protein